MKYNPHSSSRAPFDANFCVKFITAQSHPVYALYEIPSELHVVFVCVEVTDFLCLFLCMKSTYELLVYVGWLLIHRNVMMPLFMQSFHKYF